jgi:glycosyltransferase involved in cell wall biosynthesis
MIISLFYPALGGAEQQTLRLAELLTKKGVAVTILTRKMPNSKSFEIIGNVPVYRSIRTLPWGKLFGISYCLSCLWYLLRKRNSYDIIHCHILQGLHSFAAVCIKRLFNKKVAIKVAMAGAISDFAVLKKMAFANVFLRQIQQVDRLVTICSQSTQEALHEGFSPQNIIQIPNGVDIEQFTPGREAEKIRGRIIFVGTLDYRKNVSLLITAIKMLKDAGILVTLDIIGDGPEFLQLQKMTGSLDIADKINFLGAFSEIAPFLQRAHIFVLPSQFEGLPNVVLEAMACGLPVIATQVGGVPDIIQHRVNGLLIPPGDTDAICAAIRELFDNATLAEELGMRARQTVVAHFSLSAIADRYAELYKTLFQAD